MFKFNQHIALAMILFFTLTEMPAKYSAHDKDPEASIRSHIKSIRKLLAELETEVSVSFSDSGTVSSTSMSSFDGEGDESPSHDKKRTPYAQPDEIAAVAYAVAPKIFSELSPEDTKKAKSLPEISAAAQEVQIALNPELVLTVIAADSAVSSDDVGAFSRRLSEAKKASLQRAGLIKKHKKLLKLHKKNRKKLYAANLDLQNEAISRIETLVWGDGGDEGLTSHGADFLNYYVQALSTVGLYQQNAMRPDGNRLRFSASMEIESDSTVEDAILSTISFIAMTMTSELSLRSSGLVFGPETLRKANIKGIKEMDGVYFVRNDRLYVASTDDNQFMLDTSDAPIKKLKKAELRRLKAVIIALGREAIQGFQSRSPRFSELKYAARTTPEQILRSLANHEE